jgi:rubredoxin
MGGNVVREITIEERRAQWDQRPENRNAYKCLVCGFEGQMKTWLSNYSVPQFILIALSLFWIVPGLIFMACVWGKRKCPQCGALAKNIMLTYSANQTIPTTKKCPYCAETVKFEAVVCINTVAETYRNHPERIRPPNKHITPHTID